MDNTQQPVKPAMKHAEVIDDASVIEVGDLITILNWGTADRSWIGEAMEVNAMQLPFIAVRLLKDRYKISIDSRRVTFARVTREYADALSGKKPRAEQIEAAAMEGEVAK